MNTKIINSKGYRFLVAGKSYSREEHGLLAAIGYECSAKVEHVAAAIDALENPAQTLAKASGMNLDTATKLIASLKRRDAANKAALAKPPARPALTVAQLPTPPPRHAARHAASPAQAARVAVAVERGAIVATSAQYKQRQAELARRR